MSLPPIWKQILSYLIVITLAAFTIHGFLQLRNREKDLLQEKELLKFEQHYREVLETYQAFGASVLKEISSRPQVQSIMEQALIADSTHKARLQKELYELLDDTYQSLKQGNIHQLQFSLANGESFLNFNTYALKELGEQITDRQNEEVILNDFKHRQHIYQNQKKLGSIEISFSIQSLQQLLVEPEGQISLFVWNKSESPSDHTEWNILKDYHPISQSAPFSPLFKQALLLYSEDIDELGNPPHRNYLLSDSERGYSLKFLPLLNSKGQTRAILSAFQEDEEWSKLRYLNFTRLTATTLFYLLIMAHLVTYWLRKQRTKITNDALRESESRFKTIFKKDLSIKLIIDPQDGSILDYNPAAERFYGYPNLGSMKIEEINQLSREEIFLKMKSVKLNIKIHNVFPHKLASGEIRQVEVDSSEIQLEGKRVIFSIIHDIDGQFKAQKALKASEEEYRGIIENLNDVYFRTSMDGRLLKVSPSAKVHLGYPDLKQMQVGTVQELFYSKAEDRNKLLETILKEGRLVNYLVHIKDYYGKIIPFEANCKLIKDQNGIATGIEGILRNVTEHMEQLAKIREYAKALEETDAAKNKFFNLIAHDLKNPIGAIKGLSEILYLDFKRMPAKEQEEIVQHLYNAGRNTYQLLEELLNWARAENGHIPFKPREIHVSTMVNKISELSKEILNNKGLKLQVNIAPLEIIQADENMLQTIIRNLLSNAMKFSPEGKTIFIRTKAQGDYWIMEIEDQGIGMDQEMIAKLFRLDQKVSRPGTNQESGTGLGLLLVKEFVDAHKGKIEVESAPNKGSTFRIFLEQ